MLETVEVRWFGRDQRPDAVDSWFRQWGSGAEEYRADYYLLGLDRTAGMKVRGGNPTAMEMKVRVGEPGMMQWSDRVAGQVERWRKWSFGVAPGDHELARIVGSEHGGEGDSGWIEVAKRRKVARFAVADDAQGNRVTLATDGLGATRCALELTALTVGNARWWTVGYEAFGVAAELEGVLSRVVAHTVGSGVAPTLALEGSFAYPTWLSLVRAELGDAGMSGL